MAFASRHPTSPLYITLQDKVLPEHSDASSYALLNTGYKMTTGLQYEGDCIACVRFRVDVTQERAALEKFSIFSIVI